MQMIMKTEPLSSREIETFFGESKTLAASTNKDFLEKIDAPELIIPVDASKDFDINNIAHEKEYSDVIDLDEEYLYEDTGSPSRGRDSLSSAFISNKDPFSLSLSPTSSLQTRAGGLHHITFQLQNHAEVSRFQLTAGVGGVMSDKTAQRQRMGFPGQLSVIQSLAPESVLLTTNQSAEITIGVRIAMIFSTIINKTSDHDPVRHGSSL